MPRPNRFDCIQPVNPPPPPARPEPPEHLSEAARKHWRTIVAAKPSTYFDAPNQVLLECLCEHIAQSDWIAQQINALDPSVPKHFPQLRALLMMGHRQTVAITSLMTKLRLLPRVKAERKTELGYIDANGQLRPWERHV